MNKRQVKKRLKKQIVFIKRIKGLNPDDVLLFKFDVNKISWNVALAYMKKYQMFFPSNKVLMLPSISVKKWDKETLKEYARWILKTCEENK